MKKIKKLLIAPFLFFLSCTVMYGQSSNINDRAQQTMLNATKYMVEEVSTHGGYVWNYLPDMSRRWGEMEAYKTMIWVQSPGTVRMGNTFLDAYETTGNEYYYNAAQKAAAALIWGQSDAGGWNYVVDFAGDRSLKEWYSTIGKNGWRLEEFQHYYGNDTFDDDVTSDAARFLLRIYLQKIDPKYKPALEKAISFIIESQYPNGGWPQRYPLMYEFSKKGKPDYSSYYTYNDDVVWENIHFLIQCYATLGEERFLDPIYRGMNFYIITQHGKPQAGWADQYNMDLEPAGARTYEPAAISPRKTFTNAMILIQFYQYTGDRKYLARIPEAIEWLESAKLPEDMTEDGKYTHPVFVEIDTNKPIFVHRKGSNVKYGQYYVDYNDENLLGHYGGKTTIDIRGLEEAYNRIKTMPPEEVTNDSPLKVGKFTHEGTPQKYYSLTRYDFDGTPETSEVNEIINSLDSKDRWLTQNAMTSNPFNGEGRNQELTDEFASTFVGDDTDTSPFEDTSDQQYISTSTYAHNMHVLINFLRSKPNYSQK